MDVDGREDYRGDALTDLAGDLVLAVQDVHALFWLFFVLLLLQLQHRRLTLFRVQHQSIYIGKTSLLQHKQEDPADTFN